jgi:hypothetical protein
MWKRQTRPSIQRLPSSDAQIVEQQEEKQDDPKMIERCFKENIEYSLLISSTY